MQFIGASGRNFRISLKKIRLGPNHTSAMHGLRTASVLNDSAETSLSFCRTTPVRDLVLQVEDNDCVARLVSHLLGREQLRVVRARDGAECLRLFAAHAQEIALVMLDYRLPDTDGVTLCARLRAQLPDVPVLFTSGQSYAGPRTFADGNTAFLAKPFLPGQFASQVNALVSVTA